MAERHGSLSINSENIFPIIKKWLYSDHDIFYRELISNGCDAITKLKKLDVMGEYSLPEDYKPEIKVMVNPEEKTLSFIDNGLGMTAEEVEEYINQIAFSGATDFIEKYKDKSNDDQIIGHFGLGFYSSFMVADEVHIDTLSFTEGAKPVHWECDGGTEYDMEEGSWDQVGTKITLFLNDDCTQFCNEFKADEVIRKYCSFMPYEIYLSRYNTPDTQTINADEKLDTDTVVETIKPEKEEDSEKFKIVKRPVLLNNTHPLWSKTPSECTKEEYIEFYRNVFHDYKEPLFWIHLNMDYPFNLKGILYFPKINMEYESIEGVIKLYNNQVFIADNIKEVIPEFLMLLKGVIDCPDLPLNVSRSALQNDGFVKKISDYISKKVADKLAGMCKTDREEYEKYWDDISPFVKFGCLKDDKFCEKMNDYILFKNIDDKYVTLPDCLEVKKTDPDEVKDSAVDENGETVEAEVIEPSAAAESEDIADEAETDSEENGEEEDAEDDKEKKVIYYVTDPIQQSQYVGMFRQAKMDAVVLPHQIDQPFINQLEMKNEGVKFQRIDADLTDTFKAKTSKKTQKELDAQAEELQTIVREALKHEKLNVKIEKLKNKKMSSVLTISEESRRMKDMMKMYATSGMDMGMFAGDGETLVLNATHPLVEYVLAHKGDEDNTNETMICEQLYDLAKLQQGPLDAEAMSRFVDRSNDIMLALTK